MDPEPCTLYLGTADGLMSGEFDGESLDLQTHAISDNVVRDIAPHPAEPADVFVGCGLRGRGLYRTTDRGETVDQLGFEDEWVWDVTRHPTDPETIYVGTEPPMLYRSTDGGETFDPLEGITDVPSRSDWTFFHEPFFQGHIHGVSIHPDRPDHIYLGVEHGAILHSRDGGETWSAALAGCDLHRIVHDPVDPEHVLAATGSGLYEQYEAGGDWHQHDSLAGKYLHAIEFETPDRLYVYADDDDSPLYRSADGGSTWTAIGKELPAGRAVDTLRCHPTAPGWLFYAGEPHEDTGELYVSPDRGDSWQLVEDSLPKVWRLAVAPSSAGDSN